MRKCLAILLIMALVISATACSSGSGTPDNTEPAVTQASDGSSEADPTPVPATPTPTPTPEPTATPTPEPTPTPVPQGAKVSLRVPTKYITGVYDEAGTVDSITYMAKDYLGDGPDVEKKAYVYLPYGYDESKKYNVMYLCHGIGGNQNEWGLGNPASSQLKKIMDNLVKEGDIEPFIIVTACDKATALSGVSGNDLFYKFGYELRNDLIPYIESHYSTYAEYDENGYDMSATRTHRAMAGLSMGGMQTINIGMCECLDLFSWFGAFSAAPTSYAASKVASEVGKSEYTVDFFYNICGLQDNIAYWSASAAAKSLPSLSDLFVENENFMWQEKDGGHDFNIWYLGFYNFAQIAFGNEWELGE